MNKIYFSSFTGTDDRIRFIAAMEYMKEHPGTTLVVEPGVYNITSERAKWAQESVMSGAFGNNPEPIMLNPKYVYDRCLDFAGHRGSRVEAYGAKLLIDGFMEPISIRDCADVEVCGFTVDHVRKPYSKGIIMDIQGEGNNGEVLLEFAEKITPNMACPHAIPYSQRLGRYVVKCDIFAPRYVDEHHAWMKCHKITALELGDEVYLRHTCHSRPVVLIYNAQNTVVRDITIHSAPGMGITAQQSRDILVERLRVIPTVGERMSINTDAAHFASCRGKLRIDGCQFEGQGDDCINVHGYYYTIDRHDGAKAHLSIRHPHGGPGTHTQALNHPLVGDTLELTDKKTLNPVEQFRVISVTPDYEEYCCSIEFDHPLPDNVDGMVFAAPDECPELELVNCHARNHFAYFVRIRARRALVENCVAEDAFESGILLASEIFWHEGPPSVDVTVRRCRFINCARWTGYCGGIQVSVECDDKRALPHQHVVIEDNIVECREADYAIVVQNVRQAKLHDNQTLSRKEGIVVGEGVELVEI